MKLSQLVTFLNELDRFSSDSIRQSADTHLSRIISVIQAQQIGFFESNGKNLAEKLCDHKQTVFDTLDNFELDLANIRQRLLERITEEEKPLLQQSYQWYESQNSIMRGFNEYQSDFYRDDYGILRRGMDRNVESTRKDMLENIMSRLPTPVEKIRELQEARIRRYADPRYPAMFIHPGKSDLIHHMVANDPVYIVDEHYELLEPALNKFPYAYQGRLRKYVIQEVPDQEILVSIPKNQFLVCVAYDFFNYKPFEIIRQYLNELYTKLRPGGVLIMTFNDCDRPEAIELVERTSACYTPGRLIRGMAESIGYTKEFEFNDGGPWTWLELRKPGLISTIKANQVMAKKLPK